MNSRNMNYSGQTRPRSTASCCLLKGRSCGVYDLTPLQLLRSFLLSTVITLLYMYMRGQPRVCTIYWCKRITGAHYFSYFCVEAPASHPRHLHSLSNNSKMAASWRHSKDRHVSRQQVRGGSFERTSGGTTRSERVWFHPWQTFQQNQSILNIHHEIVFEQTPLFVCF